MSPENNRKGSRIAYRISQFWSGMRSSPPTQDELQPARSVLTEQQMALFLKLSPFEQRHGLRVQHALIDQGETHPDLMAAALLHDIGKIRHPLHLWDRVTIVLARELAPKKVNAWGFGEPKGWRRAFVIYNKHPKWGAELVSQVGASPLLLTLIQKHEEIESMEGLNLQEIRLVKLLRQADDWN